MERSIRVPKARTADLVTTEAGAEVLVYDQASSHIHHLNQTSAVIWRLCDGRRTVADLAQLSSRSLGHPVSEDLITEALTLLGEADLLVEPLSPTLRQTRQSRRAFLRRTAVAGGLAVPAIVSVAAPAAAGSIVSPQCGRDCTGLGDAFCQGFVGPCDTCQFVPERGISVCVV